MLRSLSIRDVVLIDRLDISFRSGLSVLTGETGAGKSILLDALGLALGRRADKRLVRHGASQAVVSAVFDPGAGNESLWELLDQHGLSFAGEDMILRRTLDADGRSRAFVNDQPVSGGLLCALGDELVEVHGQFESQRLLKVGMHGDLLDAHGGLTPAVEKTGGVFRDWKQASKDRASAEIALQAARRDEDYLRHCLDELSALAPETGEEETLAARRALLMNGEKLMEALNHAASALLSGDGVETSLRSALRDLERMAEKAEGKLDGAIEAFDKAASEVTEGLAQLDRAGRELNPDAKALEGVEERLFSLRALARKHNVAPDGLAALRQDMGKKLAALEDGSAQLEALKRKEKETRQAYTDKAQALTVARREAAVELDKALARELNPLKLGRAVFVTRVADLDEADWGEKGRDRIAFEVATNPGAPPGPLNKIASGGELSRFMLALKVVLAQADPVPTLVFDEVDTGIGGGVSSAVGERLAVLAGDVQVLVVTHSPQVAARGKHHLQVSKAVADGGVLTTVDHLGEAARKEEIARMLAGTHITDEARAAAESLLDLSAGGGGP